MLKQTFVLGLVGVFVSALIAFSAPSSALAACLANSASLQGVFDNITTAPTAGTSSTDVTTDCLADADDSLWETSPVGSVATIIIEIAGNEFTNTFGVYDAADPSKTVELFSGAATAGTTVIMQILGDGSVTVNFADSNVDFAANKFGFYLDTASNGTFFSDTSLNTGGSVGIDHMLAYQGTDTDTIQVPTLIAGLFSTAHFILAWEDLNGGGDLDYDDMVLIIESVIPMKMPEPGTLSLLGIGLAGLGFMSMLRRRRKTAT